jgi:hypothetical protein
LRVRRERQHNIVARTPIQLNNGNPTFDAKKRKWQLMDIEALCKP